MMNRTTCCFCWRGKTSWSRLRSAPGRNPPCSLDSKYPCPREAATLTYAADVPAAAGHRCHHRNRSTLGRESTRPGFWALNSPPAPGNGARRRNNSCCQSCMIQKCRHQLGWRKRSINRCLTASWGGELILGLSWRKLKDDLQLWFQTPTTWTQKRAGPLEEPMKWHTGEHGREHTDQSLWISTWTRDRTGSAGFRTYGIVNQMKAKPIETTCLGVFSYKRWKNKSDSISV